MQRWEYCHIRSSVQSSRDGISSKTELFYYKTGQSVFIDVSNHGVEMAITKLGNEGWELVSVANETGGAIPGSFLATTYYFKRPL